MNLRKIILTICRILVGTLFIISGFIKSNDPLGFSYKLSEYFQVFHIEKMFPDPIPVYLSMIICIFEMFVGFCLLLGVYKNFTAWMLLAMIIFFSFLTFYSAYFKKVTDCGCFGDAIHLKPWQSFEKDMVLLVLIIPIFFLRSMIKPLFRLRTTTTMAFVALLLSLLFTFFAYYYSPPIDFRPYAVGKDIEKQMMAPPGKDSVQMTFFYRNKITGELQSFTMDQLSHMDSTAQANLSRNDTFVERKDNVIYEAPKAPIHDFAISWHDSDVTKIFLSEKGYRLMIVQYNVEKSSVRFQNEMNKLIKAVQAEGKIKIWPLTSSSSAINEAYKKAHRVPYDFYSADETMLKTIIRSNPGLVLLHNNVIIKKWPATALPNINELDAYLK